MSQSLTANRKNERLNYDGVTPILSARKYNLTIGLVVVYGVIVNALMCAYLAPAILRINYLALLIGYIVCAIAGTLIAYQSDNPLISFLGYNLVVVPVGAVLTVCLQGYSTNVVGQAFLLTAIITVIMLLAASVFPGFFAGLGKMLFVALIGLIVAGLVCAVLKVYPAVISWVAAVIFSLYIGYDWVRAQQYIRTLDNAVDSALDIYLDVINLFIRLLSMIGDRD